MSHPSGRVSLLDKNHADLGRVFPMSAEVENSALHRWLSKTVHESRLLDDMEHPGLWHHPEGPCDGQDFEGTKTGYGAVGFTRERCLVGTQCLRLTSPTIAPVPNKKAPGRPFGRATARRIFAGEDWTAWNRLSFRVYPTAPGFHTISMLVELHNEGSTRVPDKYEREGLDFFLLTPGEWNHVVWEIPHLARDRVTALDFVYRLQGNEPGAASTVCFDIDRLELQRVDADYHEGWNVAPGGIAFSHTGYLPGSSKIAFAPGSHGPAVFDLVDAATGGVRLSKDAPAVATDLGNFRVLDFSEIEDPGEYFLRLGETTSGWFRISKDVWDRTAWKTLNFFFCQRCGYAVPGGHDVCHGDWQCVHGDRRIVINGGWHDAGDLSQGILNTTDGVYSLLRLAEVMRDQAPALGARLTEEALWGLAWIRKTRFGNGFRCSWAVMDFWTDGIIGTNDDVVFEAVNDPFTNYLAAMAVARASASLRAADPRLAERCLIEAREDWDFARHGPAGNRVKMYAHEVVVDAAGVLASVELYRATGEKAYAGAAFSLARAVMECQQTVFTEWSIPLCGFFYTDRSREKPLADAHITRCDLPVVALAELCDAFPGHADWIRWYTSAALYSEFQMTAARCCEPYRMLPGGIYRIDGAENPDFREQLRGAMKLDDTHYLRRFPVWFHLRGNNGILLTQAKALAAAARLRRDREISHLCQSQIEWVVGRNPFAQSMMYGEGYGWTPYYSAMCGDVVGAIPVGIQTRENRQEPYWPATNCYNFKEVWMYASARWLACMEEMAGRPRVEGTVADGPRGAVIFANRKTGAEMRVETDAAGRFAAVLDQGDYTASHHGVTHRLTTVPGLRRRLDFASPALRVDRVTEDHGRVAVSAAVTGRGPSRASILSTNLAVDTTDRDLTLRPGEELPVTWDCTVRDPRAPWIAVILSGGDFDGRIEISGGLPKSGT